MYDLKDQFGQIYDLSEDKHPQGLFLKIALQLANNTASLNVSCSHCEDESFRGIR